MSFGSFDKQTEAQPMSEINVTPMVDVMLVLLVIFIITAPLLTQAIKLDLPQATATTVQEKPDTIHLSLNAQGLIFWNNQGISSAALQTRLAAAARQTPQPALHLRAHRDTRYETIAQVMATAQTQGLKKIGFVTQPTERPATSFQQANGAAPQQ